MVSKIFVILIKYYLIAFNKPLSAVQSKFVLGLLTIKNNLYCPIQILSLTAFFILKFISIFSKQKAIGGYDYYIIKRTDCFFVSEVAIYLI